MPAPTVRADPAHRRRIAVLVLVLLIAGGVGVSALAKRLASLRILAAEAPDEAAARFLETARWVLAVPAIGLVVCGLLLLRLGWLGWRSGRFPPAGARLLTDQPLATGAEARRRSALVLAFAVAAIIGALLFPYLMHQRLASSLAMAKAVSERIID